VPVAARFAEALAARCALVQHDPAAHVREHAVEVELPFLAVLAPDSAIVPIVLAWDDWAHCKELADALAAVAREWPDDVLIVASSDMTHYEPAARAQQKDRIALEAIERLDGAALLEACDRHNITMCGRGPAAAAIEAARQLGAVRAELVDYRHSGMVTGDDSSVVAYAGVVVT
jgi:AmmeMemoRadiSam system protein B